MNSLGFVRIPFAIAFAGPGAGKVFMPAGSAQMLSLPEYLVIPVGVAEVLAGIGRAPSRDLVNRPSGLAAISVLFGAYWPCWWFAATQSHPMGGREFPVLLPGVALTFLPGGRVRVGRLSQPCPPDARRARF